MKHSIYIITTLLLVACQGQIYDPAQPAETVIVYRDKPNETMADIAYDRLGNHREAMDYAILDLRSKDTARFYEGSWELGDLYSIFKKDINYGLERLNAEYIRCRSN